MIFAKEIAEFSISFSFGIQQAVAENAEVARATARSVFGALSGTISALDVARAYSRWQDGVAPASEIGIQAPTAMACRMHATPLGHRSGSW
ncbi:hypothetical protein [Hoeflea sp.]|uniref:hypothetical protein n=1 Tax=Hoeflea sp. TaxID=1940281 RepID=UPI003BB06748